MSCYDGFRLPAPSECSMRSKARIDALFEDTRSVCSSSHAGGGWCAASVPEDGCCGDEDQQRRVNSAVQARIEAMFASVEAESSVPGECAAAVLPVKYMGAAPVGGRVASVRGLQEPLRQLVERIGDSVNAELEVSRRGLTFRTSELNEKNNPFRRIAVWSALKLQTRRRPNSNYNNSQDLLHAFVPLVADDRTCGPSSSTTTNSEDRHADLYRTMRGLSKDIENYPPIFAVVMRRPGAARLLECHAFACKCEEDAIAAAATLYRALLADLDATARRPRQKNGLGCVSLASVVSSTRETSPATRRKCTELWSNRPTEGANERIPPPPPPPPHQPVRPPRVKKNSMSSNANTEDEQSSSSPCTNTSTDDQDSRRKKKNSDVKAEDVLEARSRRLSSASKDQSLYESNILTRRKESNSSSSISSHIDQTSEERRMNAKNKIYDTRSSQCQTSEEEAQVIEKIYEERKPRTETTEAYNKNKSSKDRNEHTGSYDFDCCTENSLYESSRIYAKARVSDSKENDERTYEVTRRSERSTPSRKSTTDSSCSRREVYNRRQTTPCRLDEPTHAEQRRRSIASSIGSNSGTRHRDHFRDADKIYSLEPEEIYSRGTHGNSVGTHEERIYDVTRSRQYATPMKNDKAEVATRSTKQRLDRVSTMDRPIRRPSIEPPPPPVPAQNQRHSQQQQHQQQLQQQQSHRTQQQLESRQRRRSRAGSEPPTSRTEAASAPLTATTLIKRSQSDMDLDRGDLMTRVELPRRGSFLKPGSVRKRGGLDNEAGTPLGFTELFDEFRNQEGLTSVDDILAAIIDPEGMSFNDLKPLYKEFLLKLAATLTQDELYQRSASIMRRRRRPQRRRSSRSGNRPCLLRRAIKRSVSRLRSSNSAPTEFTSVIYPARRLNDRSSFGSSSSCDATRSQGVVHHRHKSNNRVLASKLGRRRSTTRCSSSKSRIGHTTSEDSDTCRRTGRGVGAANRSSSGYVSCSECSYDSESCTCVSADKCYCSLSRKASEEVAPPTQQCGCDTDSCSESNKCYCARKPVPVAHHQPSILEQLRLKGIVPAESTLSRGASPDRYKSNSRHARSLAPSKSLEYLKVRSSSVRGSTDNLALDYDLFRPDGRRSSQCSSGSEKVLVVSARDPQGRLIYVGGTERELEHSSGHYEGGRHRRSNAGSNSGHHEALSIKKSAEIAAVFGGPTRIGRRTSSTSSLRSSVSLEAGLGYLP